MRDIAVRVLGMLELIAFPVLIVCTIKKNVSGAEESKIGSKGRNGNMPKWI